jgi:hypothetical protein
MTPKLYVFGNYDTGEMVSVTASCLTAATAKLRDDYEYHNFYVESLTTTGPVKVHQ